MNNMLSAMSGQTFFAIAIFCLWASCLCPAQANEKEAQELEQAIEALIQPLVQLRADNDLLRQTPLGDLIALRKTERNLPRRLRIVECILEQLPCDSRPWVRRIIGPPHSSDEITDTYLGFGVFISFEYRAGRRVSGERGDLNRLADIKPSRKEKDSKAALAADISEEAWQEVLQEQARYDAAKAEALKKIGELYALLSVDALAGRLKQGKFSWWGPDLKRTIIERIPVGTTAQRLHDLIGKGEYEGTEETKEHYFVCNGTLTVYYVDGHIRDKSYSEWISPPW